MKYNEYNISMTLLVGTISRSVGIGNKIKMIEIEQMSLNELGKATHDKCR